MSLLPGGTIRAVLLACSALILSFAGATAQTVVPPPPGPAPPPPLSSIVATPPDAQRLSLARALVNVLHPEEAMVRSNLEMWEIRQRRSAASSPVLAKIEGEYPGATDAFVAGARPVALLHAREFVRKAKAMKTQVLAEKLSSADLDQMLHFFRTSAGARILRTQQRPGEVAKIIRQAPPGAGPVLSIDDVERGRAKAKQKSIDALSADQLLEVMKFESRPVAERYGRAIVDADRALLVLVNRPDPAWTDRESEAGTRALDQFIAATKAHGH